MNSRFVLTEGEIDIVARDRGLRWMLIKEDDSEAQVYNSVGAYADGSHFLLGGFVGDTGGISIRFPRFFDDNKYAVEPMGGLKIDYYGHPAVTAGHLVVRTDYGKSIITGWFNFDSGTKNITGSFSLFMSKDEVFMSKSLKYLGLIDRRDLGTPI